MVTVGIAAAPLAMMMQAVIAARPVVRLVLSTARWFAAV
jgi:hypothetical protein